MNKPLCQFLILCAVLLWTAQRMPAPIIVPDDTPSETPAKERVHKVMTPERKAIPVEATPAVAIPAPGQTPAEFTRRAIFNPDDRTEVVYTLSATQPFDSKMTGQKIRLTIIETSVRQPAGKAEKGVGQPSRTTRTTSIINTGRTRSVSQLRDLLREAFQRFAAGSFTPGQDLGKVGDARYGGELHFVAESADALRFDYVPATADAVRYRRVDIQKFAELLAQ